MPPGKNRRRVRSSRTREISPSSSSSFSAPYSSRFTHHGDLSDVDATDAHAYRLDGGWQPCLDRNAVILPPSYQAAFTADPTQTGRIWRYGRVSVASRPDEAEEQQRRMFGGEDGDEGLNHLGTTHDARPTAVESDTIPPSSIPTLLRYSSPVQSPTLVNRLDAESSVRRLRISHVEFESALLFHPNCDSFSSFPFSAHRHRNELMADIDNDDNNNDSTLAAPRPHLGLRP